jgi:hypothetical protein
MPFIILNTEVNHLQTSEEEKGDGIEFLNSFTLTGSQ